MNTLSAVLLTLLAAMQLPPTSETPPVPYNHFPTPTHAFVWRNWQLVEMERMADHASGIAKTVIMMGDAPLLKPLVDIPKMAELARDMLRDSLQAYNARDAEKARQIAVRDDDMDGLYRAVFDELVKIMSKTPGSASRATYLLWCAHNLERIGDRVTNIAERVIFVNTGDMQELNV